MASHPHLGLTRLAGMRLFADNLDTRPHHRSQ